jgi:hypothetical protein
MLTNYDQFNEKCVQLENAYPNFLKLTYGFEIGYGWLSIIESFLERASAYQEHIRIVQIKEKFGTLRIYYENKYPEDDDDFVPNEEANNMIRNLVEEAEFKATITCFSCGTEQNVTRKRGFGYLCHNCHTDVTTKNR